MTDTTYTREDYHVRNIRYALEMGASGYVTDYFHIRWDHEADPSDASFIFNTAASYIGEETELRIEYLFGEESGEAVITINRLDESQHFDLPDGKKCKMRYRMASNKVTERRGWWVGEVWDTQTNDNADKVRIREVRGDR